VAERVSGNSEECLRGPEAFPGNAGPKPQAVFGDVSDGISAVERFVRQWSKPNERWHDESCAAAATSDHQQASTTRARTEPATEQRALPVAPAPIADLMAWPLGPAQPVRMQKSGPLQQKPAANVDIEDAVLTIVAEKTGYPKEILDLATDLESGLGIDSIKRVEILSAIQEVFPELKACGQSQAGGHAYVGRNNRLLPQQFPRRLPRPLRRSRSRRHHSLQTRRMRLFPMTSQT
jgi:hypothetical protein